MSSESLYKWIEYYKVKFKSKTFTPISPNKKTGAYDPRFDAGYIGYYNKYKLSPFWSLLFGVVTGTTGYSK